MNVLPPCLRSAASVTVSVLVATITTGSTTATGAYEQGERLTPYRDRLFSKGWLRDVTLDGYRFAFVDAGSGPPLLLLHGLGGSLYDWRHLLDELAEDHRVIVPDLLGAGESDKPEHGDYSVVAQARRLRGLLDHLKIEKISLAGNSYGGGIALAFAQYWPDRMNRLVLINSICYPDRIPFYADLARVPGSEEVVKVLPVEEITGWVLRRNYKNEDLLSPEELATYVLELDSRERREAVVRTCRALLPGDTTEFLARLRTIETEALLLWGKSDDTVPLELGKRLADDLPHARLVELDADHLPNQECPQEVLALMKEFLGDEER